MPSREKDKSSLSVSSPLTLDRLQMDRLDSGSFFLTFIDSCNKHTECAYYVPTRYQLMKRAGKVVLDHVI